MFDEGKSEQNKLFAVDIAKALYNLTVSDTPPNEEEADQFLLKLRNMLMKA